MSILTLQPDATAGIDTHLIENNPDTASPTGTTVQTLGTAGSRRHGLIKFDLSSIPAGSTVTSAVMTFFCGVSTANARTISIHRILPASSGWVEGATWNYANPSTVRWAGDTGADGGSDAGCSVAGTDYQAAATGSFTMAASDPADTQYDATLTNADIETMLTANHGFVLVRAGDVTTKSLKSSDATDATKRPQLVVNYTEAGGADDFLARTIEIGGQFGVMTLPTGGAGLVVVN